MLGSTSEPVGLLALSSVKASDRRRSTGPPPAGQRESVGALRQREAALAFERQRLQQLPGDL